MIPLLLIFILIDNFHNVIRKLLCFGEVSWYLGYNALTDYFPRMMLKPNPNCDDNFCQKRQAEQAKILAEAPPPPPVKHEEKAVIHEDNEWGWYCKCL